MSEQKFVAYCGLDCENCFGHTGVIADLARDLRKELRAVKFEKFAEFMSQYPFAGAYRDYDKCYAVLGMMVKFRCSRLCRDGGGPPFCKMRKCCIKKGFAGCWECPDFETCEKLDFLRPVHGDAHLLNLRLLKKKGVENFRKGKKHWYHPEKRGGDSP
jgi:hypothetical protein